MNMMLGNTFFKKSGTQVVDYESGLLKTQVDHCLERRDQRKFVKDISVQPGKECITQHKPLMYGFKIK